MSKVIKVSKLSTRNIDKKTDSLYEPLRRAVLIKPQQTQYSLIETQTASNLSNSSKFIKGKRNMTMEDQLIMQQSTYIPYNKKLVETKNPENERNAKSRKYRAISIESKIGLPMNAHSLVKQTKPYQRKEQIVYQYGSLKNSFLKSPKINFTNQPSGQQNNTNGIPRTRSQTRVDSFYYNLTNRVERVTSEAVAFPICRTPSGLTKIQHETLDTNSRSKETIGQYYEGVSKYKFKNIDSKIKDYKYNLFSVLDEQLNFQCEGGLCSSGNQIVAGKIKNKW